jgi:LPS O-antigen subunit length determinant protein (WzzB/FepE family)
MVQNGSDSDTSLNEMLYILWKKKWLIILVSGLCAFLGFSYYRITYTDTSPMSISKEIKKYIKFINQQTLQEVVRI